MRKLRFALCLSAALVAGLAVSALLAAFDASPASAATGSDRAAAAEWNRLPSTANKDGAGREPPDAPRAAGTTQEAAKAIVMAGLPLLFVPNAGQMDPAAAFAVRGQGYSLYFALDEVVFQAVQGEGAEAERVVVRLAFAGANPAPAIEGLAPLAGVANFFHGRDPSQWRANVPTYAAVAYRDLYPGIDLIYGGVEGQLKSELRLAPGSDAGLIERVYTGAASLRLQADGALLLETEAGELVEAAPVAYQEVGGERRPVAAAYALRGPGRVGFTLGAYDPALPLVIDPVLEFSTYLGGTGIDYAYAVATDAAGSVYIAGQAGEGFPLIDELDVVQNDYEAFVTKLVRQGGVYTYAYSTYLGGASGDIAYALAVDPQGNAIVGGQTSCADFPLRGAVDANCETPWEGFVSQIISASGGYTLGLSTYLGGDSDADYLRGVAVDSAGNIYAAGSTRSSNWPLKNAFHGDLDATALDIFVTQIISSGGVYTYGFSTYLGGTLGEFGDGHDEGYAIAVDADQSIYLAGSTESTNFPLRAELQSNQWGTDAVLVKLVKAGAVYTYGLSTYLGGNSFEFGYALALDSAGGVYVAGETNSTDFPRWQSLQGPAGYDDAYVTKIISASGAYTFAFSTYLGGNRNDWALGVAVSADGAIHLAGYSASSNYPAVNAFKATNAVDHNNAIVTKIISASGSYTYAFSTYLGGTNYTDQAYAVAVDGEGNTWVVGLAASTNFPLVSPFDSVNGPAGSTDVFVARIGAGRYDLAISKQATPAGVLAPGRQLTYTLRFTNTGSGTATRVLITDVVTGTLGGASFTSGGVPVTATGSVSYAWQAGPLAPGQAGVITITGYLSPPLGFSGVFTLSNQAVIGPGQTYAVDENAANSTARAEVVVDNEPPLAPARLLPANGAVLSDTTPTLEWATGESAAGYLLDWQGLMLDMGSATAYATGVLANGTYTWNVLAYDAAGNVSPAEPPWLFIIYAGPPAPTLLAPANGAVLSDTTPTLAWAASDGAAGYWLDLGSDETDAGNTTSWTTTALADGTYTWTVAAYDAEGSRSAKASPWAFTIDTAPPAAPTLLSPADGAALGAAPNLQWAAVAGAVAYRVDLNGSVIEAGAALTYQPGALVVGVYTWTVAASDQAGNWGDFAAPRAFAIHAPVAGLAAAASSPTLLGQPTAFTATVSTGSSVTFLWNCEGDLHAGAAVTHTYTSAGIYTAVVTATNPLNELAASAVVTIYETLALPPGGGVYTTSDGLLALGWPPGLTQTLALTYTPQLTPGAALGGFEFAGVAFQLQATGADGQPVADLPPGFTLTVHYDEAALPIGMDEATLEVRRYDAALAEWTALPVVDRDLAGDRLTVHLDHLSTFALLLPTTIEHRLYLPLIQHGAAPLELTAIGAQRPTRHRAGSGQ